MLELVETEKPTTKSLPKTAKTTSPQHKNVKSPKKPEKSA
jgi:hypothetical protein